MGISTIATPPDTPFTNGNYQMILTKANHEGVGEILATVAIVAFVTISKVLGTVLIK